MFSASVGPWQKTRTYRRKKRALGHVFATVRFTVAKNPDKCPNLRTVGNYMSNCRKKHTSRLVCIKILYIFVVYTVSGPKLYVLSLFWCIHTVFCILPRLHTTYLPSSISYLFLEFLVRNFACSRKVVRSFPWRWAAASTSSERMDVTLDG